MQSDPPESHDGRKFQTPDSAIKVSSPDKKLVLGKCDSFVDFQVWPSSTEINPRNWLKNFNDKEERHAVHLLNAFMYYSEPFTKALFYAAFQNISSSMSADTNTFAEAVIKWQAFCDSLIVTYVTGEEPNPTDSGLLFARMARRVLRIDEDNILSPDDALNQQILDHSRPILFVDDFVGSGNQFVKMWKSNRPGSASTPRSFASLASTFPDTKHYYCPTICTAYGLSAISSACPRVTISAGNILGPTYNALHPDSVVWPDALRPTAHEFLRVASDRAGLGDKGGGVNDWRGFHNLGLALAFSHSVPDATLPIFYSEMNGWRPLVRRS